jgi:hypothetical protein
MDARYWKEIAPAPWVSGPLALCAVVFCAVLSGCSGRESADKALDRALQNAGQSRQVVYPLAGKVVIDGQVPQLANKMKLIVMLNDTKKPDEPLANRLYEVCDAQGEFVFHTYTRNDGVPEGKYILTVAELDFNKKRGYQGPDKLQNLYNDPDKNAQVAQFVVDHKPPGKSDYVLNLEVAGKEPGSSGPKALTELRDR